MFVNFLQLVGFYS